VCTSTRLGVDYIEDMLYKQIVSAIGKVVGPVDFQQYVRFHMRKLYRAQYQPLPFSHAVRRPGYTPEGTVSIEAQMDDGGVADPIMTICSRGRPARPMSFALDASTRVSFTGERLVHGWINQQFAGASGLRLSLVRLLLSLAVVCAVCCVVWCCVLCGCCVVFVLFVCVLCLLLCCVRALLLCAVCLLLCVLFVPWASLQRVCVLCALCSVLFVFLLFLLLLLLLRVCCVPLC
jgi:hypothetical protein